MNMSGSDGTPTAEQLRAQAAAHSAHNYHPLPVVIAEAEGAWVTDVAGRRYLDLLAAYSAVNFGHRHPRLVAAAQRQLERVTLVCWAVSPSRSGGRREWWCRGRGSWPACARPAPSAAR